MNSRARVHLYLFSDEEERNGGRADARVFRCARDFLQAQGKTNVELPEIYAQNHEKPRFAADIGVHFSVSHSGKYWGCAVCEQPIGLDIQHKSSKRQEGVAKRFFHPDEHQYLAQSDFKGFFDIWTAKESYVKYTGQGIDDAFSAFSVVRNGQVCAEVGEAYLRFIPLTSEYCVCLCAKDLCGVGITVLLDPDQG